MVEKDGGKAVMSDKSEALTHHSLLMNPLAKNVELMKYGLVETQRDFVCPICGGQAHVQASIPMRGAQKYINVSAWCEDCKAAIEEDGSPEWPGWEAIKVSI
jgi:hypothetical protein